MKSFTDLLETTAAASSSDAERNLTTVTAVKTALRITITDTDALIGDLIPRVSQLIIDHCRLARDAAGGKPTFARETLRATWHMNAEGGRRGAELFLPWRLPLYTVDSVVEDGVTLTVNTDFLLVGSRPAKLRRMSGDTRVEWSDAKIVVVFKAGYASTLSTNIDDALEAAAIEQLRGWVMGADRDPSIRSTNSPDIGAESYSQPGGDVMGNYVLYPQVRDMLATWRNPVP